MRRVKNIEKITDNRFLNMYELTMKNDNGKESKYFLASRAKGIDELKISTKENKADAVIIYSIHKDKDGKEYVILIKQYRCPLDGYIYEFPAGLVDDGETFQEAGVRELKEETGLDLKCIEANEMFMKPCFSSVGMTDESCATVYGYAEGSISKEWQEENEEIEIVLADKDEVRRILKEENVSIKCAYMLMHFMNTSEGHTFDFLKN